MTYLNNSGKHPEKTKVFVFTTTFVTQNSTIHKLGCSCKNDILLHQNGQQTLRDVATMPAARGPYLVNVIWYGCVNVAFVATIAIAIN